jgi:hypothetical protein
MTGSKNADTAFLTGQLLCCVQPAAVVACRRFGLWQSSLLLPAKSPISCCVGVRMLTLDKQIALKPQKQTAAVENIRRL